MKNKEFIKKYSTMSAEALSKEILSRKERINSLMFDTTRGKISNVREMKMTRREIAKLHTLLERKQQ